MEILNNLNKEQKLAVISQAQHIRVIAGAGSGKTRVLISRIIYLMRERMIAPYKICAITFTNKAAQEMKDRLTQYDSQSNAVNTSTIHALCVRILRDEHVAIGMTRYFTILDTADQESILREIYKARGIDRKKISFRNALSYISDVKFSNKAATPLSYLSYDPWTLDLYEAIYTGYVKRTKALQAFDFDDLLIETHNLLKSNEVVRTRWQSRFEVILVDEFQDVDNVQYGIIQSLAGKDNQLYVVGDPDQTIYTWRGADVKNITEFSKIYPDAETITLHQNYRSTQTILDAANNIIQYNNDRTDKELLAVKEEIHDIHYQEFPSADDESYWIASTIKQLVDQGEGYDEIAVLYRSSYLTRALERTLVQRGIPYIVYGGLRFYERKEIKDVVSFLRMITHSDDLSLRRSIGARPCGIGNKSLENIWDQSLELGMTMYEVMLRDVMTKSAGPRIRDYVNLIESLKEASESLPIADLIQEILDKGGLASYYKQKDEEDRIENVMELKVDAMNFSQVSDQASLDEYIQMVSLYGEKADVKLESHVRLMTIHASKGLEFNDVFIMGASESIFPSKRAIQDGKNVALEEERRLMYVAITRAKERLYVTNNSDFSYVLGHSLRPSRFVKEAQLNQIKKEESVRQIPRIHYHDDIEDDEEEDFNLRFKNGDTVYHSVFGMGIVISMDKSNYTIAFAHPHGIKIISKQFQGLRPKESIS